MGQYSYTGSAKYVTVGATGEYDITAYGAQGGITASGNANYVGGYGAEAGGFSSSLPARSWRLSSAARAVAAAS